MHACFVLVCFYVSCFNQQDDVTDISPQDGSQTLKIQWSNNKSWGENLTKPQLIEIPSLARSPVAPVLFSLSEPARSTKWNLAVSVSYSSISEFPLVTLLSISCCMTEDKFISHTALRYSCSCNFFSDTQTVRTLSEAQTRTWHRWMVKMACERELWTFIWVLAVVRDRAPSFRHCIIWTARERET